MTGFFLAFLTIAWLAIVVPAGLRARETTPFSTAERFKRRMQLIAPRAYNGRWVVVPAPREELAKVQFRRHQARRRRILYGLVLATVASTMAAFVVGGVMVQVTLSSCGCLTIYVSLLIEAKRRHEERRMKVRSIDEHRIHAQSWPEFPGSTEVAAGH